MPDAPPHLPSSPASSGARAPQVQLGSRSPQSPPVDHATPAASPCRSRCPSCLRWSRNGNWKGARQDRVYGCACALLAAALACSRPVMEWLVLYHGREEDVRGYCECEFHRNACAGPNSYISIPNTRPRLLLDNWDMRAVMAAWRKRNRQRPQFVLVTDSLFDARPRDCPYVLLETHLGSVIRARTRGEQRFC